MTDKGTYTSEEWALLTRLPVEISYCVMVAEDSGSRGTKKELKALVAAPDKIAQSFQENELVKSALEEVNALCVNSLIEKHSRERETSSFMNFVAEECEKAAIILKQKSVPEEAAGYKHFALGMAAEVANAARDAELLGIGGETMSLRERQVLKRFRRAVGLRE
jgi:hypothetical protein